MDRASISTAASALLAVRRGAPPIAALPAGCEPASLPEAYAIQDAMTRHLTPVAGWKIAPMPDDGPLWCAPLHAHSILDRPTLPGRDLNRPIVEIEIAFRMTRDIAAGASTEALCGAMELVPLFEVLSTRFTTLFTAPFLSNLADGYATFAIGLGDPIADWAGIDRSSLTLSLDVDGAVIERFDYGARLDYAIGLMARFAERFEGRADILPAGTIVTTGSMRAFPPGRRIVADYGPFGVNELNFSDLPGG